MFGHRSIPLAVVTATLLLLTPCAAHAQQDSALLDLLVKKGIITASEAKGLRAELAKKPEPKPEPQAADKLKLSKPLMELELYGDARVRYEIRSGEGGPPANVAENDTLRRNRARYRLRLGLRGKLTDDWFFGLRLETGAGARSTNVTFGDDAGPFGKTSDGAFIGQAYLGYKGIDGLTLTAGKLPNPFVTTSMVWDSDINPEGLSQQYKYTVKFAGSESVASYSKDGKAIAAAKTEGMTIDLFANLGQFVYDDANPDRRIGNANPEIPSTDAYLLGWQVGARFNFTKDLYFQLAPTIYNYTGAGDTFHVFYQGGPGTTTSNQTGVNSLLIFNMPAEFGFKAGKVPVRLFSDFAVNLEAEDRARAAGRPDKGDQRYAYQIGVAAGRIRAKHDWQVSAFWQHTEQFSLDPNLVDSDIFDSRVNMEGFAVQAGYALSDAVTFNLTYAYGNQADKSLGTGGSGDIGFNPLRDYQLFQADLSWKF
jgi:hypothetical protein